MSKLKFTHNPEPTIGVEIELQMVDAESYELASAVEKVLSQLPEHAKAQIKPELMQSYVELNTGVCKTVREAGDDLRSLLEDLERITDPLGINLFWAGTHPFSSWRDQKITNDERYHHLVELMQDVARRLLSFGLHVHIGVDTGDKAVMICDRMLRYLPLLLALSANSPFWEGRFTGIHSYRSKLMEALPTAGLPHQMRNWSEYAWLVNHLIETGFINSIRELWWDIRPHHNFGTVEIRVCDMPPNLNQVVAITALVQCLVHAISGEIDEGTFQSEYHPMMVKQNKWRASRYGGDARLVAVDTFKQHSVQQLTDALIAKLLPMAEELDCVEELKSATHLPANTGAAQQIAVFEESQSRRAVVERLLQQNPWK